MVKRIVPHTDKWERLANAEARKFCPSITPCVECGHPVVNGYCCNFCGNVDPSGNQEQRDEFYKWVREQQKNG